MNTLLANIIASVALVTVIAMPAYAERKETRGDHKKAHSEHRQEHRAEHRKEHIKMHHRDHRRHFYTHRQHKPLAHFRSHRNAYHHTHKHPVKHCNHASHRDYSIALQHYGYTLGLTSSNDFYFSYRHRH